MKSYITIGKYTVFITRYLLDKVFKHIESNELERMRDLNMYDKDKAWDNAVIETLTSQYNTNNIQFYDRWVKFEVEGEQAQDDTLFYLDNYCKFYKNAFLVSESKSYVIETQSLVMGNTVSYDGTKFYISLPGEKRKVTMFKQENTVTRVLVDTKKVTKIFGDYNYFEIVFNNDCKLCCSKDNFIVTL